MTRKEFLRYIEHPDSLGPEDTREIRNIVEKFPYCAASQILFSYSLFRSNDLDFPTQLKRTAAYASSRKRIKKLFEDFRTGDAAPASPEEIIRIPDTAEPEEIVVSPAQVLQPEIEPVAEIPEEELKTEEELILIVRRRLEEIMAEREAEAALIESETQPVSVTPESKVTRKEDIIDKFIRDEPRMSPPRTSFFNPAEIALKSNLDEDDIVSETLARLYYEQGNLPKAKRIYEKLILLFPEKSRYFADQIEKMKQ